MDEITDGTLVEAMIEANMESFEFDNYGLDYFEDILSIVNEADLADAVSVLASAAYSDSTSDHQSATDATTSYNTISSSSSSTRDSLHRMEQVEHSGAIQSVHPNIGRTCSVLYPSKIGFSHPIHPQGDAFDLHRQPSEARTATEFPVYARNMHPVEGDFHRLERSAMLKSRNNQQAGYVEQNHGHFPSHLSQHQPQQPRVIPGDPYTHRLVPATLDKNAREMYSDKLMDFNRMGVHDLQNSSPDVKVDLVPYPMPGRHPAENGLSFEDLMNDRFLEHISSVSDDHLHKIVTGSEAFSVQPSSNTVHLPSQKVDQPCSSYPDTPPESGSEAHSPPGNVQTLGSDLTANDVGSMRSDGSNQAVPGSRSTLPPYHSTHTTSSSPHASVPQNATLKTKLPTSFSPASGPPMATLDPQLLLSEYNRGSLNHKNKKRKHSISPQSTINPSILNVLTISSVSAHVPVKPEPVTISDCSEDDTCGYDNTNEMNSGCYQSIKWNNYLQPNWATLLADNGQESPISTYRVDADKGFNFSTHDESFVCQKKNHFQVTVHIAFPSCPKFVKTAEELEKIDELCLNFNGIKMESPNQKIKIEQSQSDRSKRPLHPVRVDLGSSPQPSAKAVIGRLHFSETTTNNMRKRGKPNPDQRYFQLVVSLTAQCGQNSYIIAAQVSERIIVRASNPGQFDGDVDSLWNKGKVPDSVCHMGNVGVNVENPDEALTVHGNIKLTGHVIAPSDVRAKTDIKELDTSQQLKNISQINVYHYRYDNKFAKFAGIDPSARIDTGVLAQEVSLILPDAVHEVGDVVLPDGERIEKFLVVNKDRIFIEGIGAVKELCKVTDKLEGRINEIEIMSKKLTKNGNNRDSIKSTQSISSCVSSCSNISQSDSQLPSNLPGKAPSSRLSTQESTYEPHRSHHHHRHHHHRHRRNPEGIPNKEKGPCSNRVVQIIIIILVLIMALCLIAITLLYVLEMVAGNKTAGSTTPINGTDSNNTTPLPPSPNSTNGGPPLIWPYCLRISCPITSCCATTLSAENLSTDVIPDYLTSSTAVMDTDTNAITETVSSTLSNSPEVYISVASSGLHGSPGLRMTRTISTSGTASTRMVAASDQGADDSMNNQDTVPKPSDQQLSPNIGTPGGIEDQSKRMRRLTTVIAGDRVLSLKKDDRQLSLATRSPDPPVMSSSVGTTNIQTNPTNEVHPRYSFFNKPLKTSVFAILGDEIAHRERRLAKMIPLPPVVEILIKLANETTNLTSNYCMPENCQDQSGGRFVYEIPLSGTFPRVSINIQFVLHSDNVQHVVLCNTSFVNDCLTVESDKVFTDPWDLSNEWTLPVGMFHQSSFSFRIPSKEDDKSVPKSICDTSDDYAETLYNEYVLTFVRQCST